MTDFLLRMSYKNNLVALHKILEHSIYVDLTYGDALVRWVLRDEHFGGSESLFSEAYSESNRSSLDILFGDNAFSKLFARPNEGLLDKKLDKRSLVPPHTVLTTDLELLKDRVMEMLTEINKEDLIEQRMWYDF